MKRKTIKTMLAIGLLFLVQHAGAEILGNLEHPENFNLSIHASWIDYGVDLSSRNFQVRLPSDYDPNETYGLVSFINSGSGGGAPTAWRPILDKYRLIWVGGDNIGNSYDTSLRRGVGILGAMRMTELYPNIDSNRIYASGTSGGSRMASGLVLMRDDFFKGIIGNVGFGVADYIPDDFLAAVDDYYYEYNAEGDSQTSARTAQQTFYNATVQSNEGEFRERENLSIYHLSMIPNGNESRLVDSPGDHGTTLEYAFEEAVKWMNHPLIPVIEDEFGNLDAASNPDIGNGFSTISSNAGNVAEISISGIAAGSVEVVRLAADAEIRSHDAFSWNDDYGMRLTAALRSDNAGSYNQRMEVGLVPADVREAAAFKLVIEQTGPTTKHAELVIVERGGIPLTLCSFSFEGGDEPINRSANDRAYFRNNAPTYDGPGYNFRGLDIYWFMDDDKFQINFRQNIDRATFSSELSTPPVLLIDRWTIQGRWSDMGLSEWIERMKPVDGWRVCLKNQAIGGGAADAAYVDFVQVHGSRPGKVAALDGSESTGLRFDQQGGADQLLAFEAEAFNRQEVQGLHRWVTTSSVAGYSGSGAVATVANNGTEYASGSISSWSARLDYCLKFITNGSYNVWVRAQAPDAADDACWLGFNEDGSGAVNVSGFGAGSYTWVSRTIEVDSPGDAMFYLWVGEDGLVVDQILLTPNQGYTPVGAVPAPAGTELELFFGAPGAPAGLTASPGNGSVALDWADNFEADFASYNIYRSTVGGVYGETPLAQGIVASEYVDQSVVNDTTYYYVLTAVDADGNESAASTEASVTPVLDVTHKLDILGNSTGASGGEFADYSSLVDGNLWGDSSDDDGTVQLSVSRTGFNSDVSISKWRSTAYLGNGTEINYSTGSTTLSNHFASIAQRAFVAIKLDSTGFGSDEFTLDALSVTQWRGNAAESPTYFQFAYDAEGDGYDTGDLVGSPATNTADGALDTFVVSNALARAYSTRHEVRLYYWGGGAAWAPTHLFMVEAFYRLSLADPSDTTPPVAPTNLVAVGNPGQISLSWNTNTDSDLSAAPYTLYRSATSGSGYSAIASNLSDTAYADSDVVAGETWYYVLTANDVSGNESAFSAEASATAQATAVVLVNEDFAIAPGFTAVDENNSGWAIGVDRLGWYLSPVANFTTPEGSLNLASFIRGATGPRFTTALWAIDIDGAGAATYTVQFDVNNFTAGSADLTRTNWFEVYRVSGLGMLASGNTILVDFGDNAIRTVMDVAAVNGTAGYSLLSSAGITGDQSGFQVNFALDSAGGEGDVLFLVWNRQMDASVAGYGSDSFSVDNLTISAVGGQGGYAVWAASFGGTNTIGSAMADFDGDGVSNLGEYALNGNPTNANERGLAVAQVEDSIFTLVYASNTVDSSLIYTLFDRTNLVTGSVNTNQWDSQTFGTIIDHYITVSNHYDTLGEDSLFIQLQIGQE